MIDLYAGALAVVFPPFDEDYGYVTLEAFLSHKPVVTTTDAGGPNEFVSDGVNGYVTDTRSPGHRRGRRLARRRSTPRGTDGRRRLRSGAEHHVGERDRPADERLTWRN